MAFLIIVWLYWIIHETTLCLPTTNSITNSPFFRNWLQVEVIFFLHLDYQIVTKLNKMSNLARMVNCSRSVVMARWQKPVISAAVQVIFFLKKWNLTFQKIREIKDINFTKFVFFKYFFWIFSMNINVSTLQRCWN